uniref:Progestin and adipoQ receptor family member 3 n=1 Tax=Steinernema glaseri TaxID=37863 RepID=A0A1I7ZIC2_9BILA
MAPRSRRQVVRVPNRWAEELKQKNDPEWYFFYWHIEILCHVLNLTNAGNLLYHYGLVFVNGAFSGDLFEELIYVYMAMFTIGFSVALYTHSPEKILRVLQFQSLIGCFWLITAVEAGYVAYTTGFTSISRKELTAFARRIAIVGYLFLTRPLYDWYADYLWEFPKTKRRK